MLFQAKDQPNGPNTICPYQSLSFDLSWSLISLFLLCLQLLEVKQWMCIYLYVWMCVHAPRLLQVRKNLCACTGLSRHVTTPGILNSDRKNDITYLKW